MTKYAGKDVAFLLVDGYSLLGYETEFSDSKEAMLEDSTVLGDSWMSSLFVGLRKATFEQKGFFDDTANAVNDALVSNTGISRILNYGVEGNTIGKKFVGFSGAMQVNYERVASRGALHKANAKYLGNGQVDEGVILHTLSAESASSGNTQATSHDNAAQTTNGAVAYLQVPSLTLGGWTSVTFVIRDSADNSTFADVASGTFTNVTAAPNAQRLAIPGTIRRYTAVRWAFNGAGAGQSVTFMCGLSRG